MNSLRSKTILFRVEANNHIGMGHIFMCMFLAKLFSDYLKYKSIFLMTKYSIDNACDLLKDKNINCLNISGENKYKEDFNITKKIIEDIKPEFIVFDLLTKGKTDEDLDNDKRVELINIKEYIEKIKSSGQNTIAVSYETEYINLKPHILIAPSPIQENITYQDDGVKRLLGLKYFLLDNNFAKYTGKKKIIKKKAKKILFAFGGSDYNNIGLNLAHALKNINFLDKTVIIGPGVSDPIKLKREFNDLGVKTKLSPKDLSKNFWNTDIAVTNGGNMLFELIACGTPTLVISARERQKEFSKYMESLGGCIFLGMHNQVDMNEFANYIKTFSFDFKKRKELYSKSKELIDGKSGKRIIETVRKCFN